jgi:hypothetical protein
MSLLVVEEYEPCILRRPRPNECRLRLSRGRRRCHCRRRRITVHRPSNRLVSIRHMANTARREQTAPHRRRTRSCCMIASFSTFVRADDSSPMSTFDWVMYCSRCACFAASVSFSVGVAAGICTAGRRGTSTRRCRGVRGASDGKVDWVKCPFAGTADWPERSGLASWATGANATISGGCTASRTALSMNASTSASTEGDSAGVPVAAAAGGTSATCGETSPLVVDSVVLTSTIGVCAAACASAMTARAHGEISGTTGSSRRDDRAGAALVAAGGCIGACPSLANEATPRRISIASREGVSVVRDSSAASGLMRSPAEFSGVPRGRSFADEEGMPSRALGVAGGSTRHR